VPALVTLAGRGYWWAPAPLVRLHRRVGITENGREVAGQTGATPGAQQLTAATQPVFRRRLSDVLGEPPG
jgi:hypothetical protein